MSLWTGKKILIVDDSADMRQLLRHVFGEMGLQVVGDVVNGVEALKFLQDHSVDVISLDVIMPEMDGIECYRKVRETYPEVVAMIVSCLASETRVCESFPEEIPSYVFTAKPFTKQSLGESLDNLLRDDDMGEDIEAESGAKIPDVNQIA